MTTEPHFLRVGRELRAAPQTWLITGVAGFIGSHLLEKLLSLEQRVVGLDNFETGFQANLDDVKARVPAAQWARFRFISGDIRDAGAAAAACAGVDYVLHQAALGSVPRSIENPLHAHENNVDGSFRLLLASRDAGVKRFVYASSSAVYGDHPGLPKVEDQTGAPLSPYAVTKVVNELYADVFRRCYGMATVGLRYFNVFGPRQNPAGAYAAVIPCWIAAALRGETLFINGDGATSRDFCFIENVVQANVLAATAPGAGVGGAFNIACGDRVTLVELADRIRQAVRPFRGPHPESQVVFRPERAGDVKHSMANVDRAKAVLGYAPTHAIDEGLRPTVAWYAAEAGRRSPGPGGTLPVDRGAVVL